MKEIGKLDKELAKLTAIIDKKMISILDCSQKEKLN